MSNPLSFDLDALVASLSGLQVFDPPSTGWNLGDSAYFIAGNSEYSLDKPNTYQSTFALTTQVMDTFNDFFDAVLTALPTLGLTQAQVDQVTQTIDTWRSDLEGQTSLPSLVINAQVNHINNSLRDDHATLQVTVAWFEALGRYVPVTWGVAYAWGVDALQVISAGVLETLDGVKGKVETLITLAIEGTFSVVDFLVGIEVGLAFALYQRGVQGVDKALDDGGKTYFSAVVAQCFMRLLDAIQAPGQVTASSVPMPRAGAIGQPWAATYSGSSLLKDTSYPWYADLQQTAQRYNYQVNLPELGWVNGGQVALISFKVKVFQHTNGFASVMLFVANNGQLIACSGATQVGASDTLYSVPAMMRQPGQTADQLIHAFAMSYPDIQATTNAPSELYLPTFLEGVMQAIVATFDRATDWAGVCHPPLPSVTGAAATRYDSGNRPVIAVNAQNDALEFHTNFSNGMYRDTLRVSGDTVALSAYLNAYQDGEDPSVALLSDGQTVIEVHGGWDHNKLYWNSMTLSSSGSVSNSTSKGDDYDKGESPCIAASSVGGVDRIFEVHRAGSATSDQLYYNTATWDGSSLDWDKDGTNREYANGEYPAITFAPDQTTLVEAHCTPLNSAWLDGMGFRAYDIWVMAGTTTATSVSFKGAQNVMRGTRPTLVVRSGYTVVLFGVQDEHLVYALGFLSGTTITWSLTGQRYAPGDEPNLKLRADNKMVLVYESNDEPAATLYGAILDLQVPPGFAIP